MIKSRDLDNRQELGEEAEPKDGRPAAPSSRPRGGLDTPRSNEAEARQALTDRIAQAKLLQPKGSEKHCQDCWQRGRDAAIRLIQGEADI